MAGDDDAPQIVGVDGLGVNAHTSETGPYPSTSDYRGR